MTNPVFQDLAQAARAAQPVVLGIISGVKGSSPQKAGAKALFYPDGRIVGTLGGGCLEAEVQIRAVQALRCGRPEQFELVLDHDFGWDDGLICGGKVQGLIIPNAQAAGWEFWNRLALRSEQITWAVKHDFSLSFLPAIPMASGHNETSPEFGRVLYQETVALACPLWIAGAGHIGRAVAPLAQDLDFAVSVFDDRPALVTPAYFPPGVILRSETWERMLAESPDREPAFALIVTRGHRHDSLVLRDWIHKRFAFIGMIGSHRKARTIFEHFLAEKIASQEDLQRVACPVGIAIRSETVAEIAISIMAQFIDKRAEAISAQPARCPTAASEAGAAPLSRFAQGSA